MFQQNNLVKLTNQSQGAFDKYAYKSDIDNIDTISSAGYFSKSRFANDPEWVGSVIEVYSSNGYMTGRINADGSVSPEFFNSNQGGYVVISDGRYTEASPLSISNGVKTKLDLDLAQADFVITERIDLNYDNDLKLFFPQTVNDFFLSEIRFRCIAGTQNRYLELFLESPGATFNPITGKSVALVKGAGVTQFVSVDGRFYVGEYARDNGLAPYITPVGTNIDIFDITYIYQKTFAAG